MAEKTKPPPITGVKPVPMKLFATWEVDRTPPNCIPRLCSLTLTRLVIDRTLGSDLVSIVIAVKMQGSKRTLRSNEIVIPQNGFLDTELQLNFSLQYPHFLKRDGNKLHIMLQRRKRYKNRTILGYKTLAEGIINMSQVLQRQMDLELDLLSDTKESKVHTNIVARVMVNCLTSQPVDHESTMKSVQSGRVGDYSDEEEEFSSNDEGSDSEPMLEDSHRGRKASMQPDRQRNLKQKFISLLKRFRVNEDLQGLDADRDVGRKLSGDGMDPTEIEDLFEELEDLSDSGPEVDTLSISSTPKPSLRPFFSSSRSLIHEALNVPGRALYNGSSLPHSISQLQLADRGCERLSDESSKKADSDSDPAPTASSPPKNLYDKKEPSEKEKKGRLFSRDKNLSGGKKKNVPEKTLNVISPGHLTRDLNPNEPRQVVVEHLTRVVATDDWLPDHLTIVNTGDPLGSLLAACLQENNHKVICTAGSSDVKATIMFVVNKIQKISNTTARSPPVIKLVLVGSDSFLNCVLRHYVEQLSVKPPDWQNYIKFLIVPLGFNTLCHYLGSVDELYNATFVSESWRDIIEKADTEEVVNRIERYIQRASLTLNLPIAEAMLTYKEKSSDDESSQIFIPFMNDVRLGSFDLVTTTSLELEDSFGSCFNPVPPPSGSPPSSLGSNPDKRVTPPSSPNMNSLNITPNKEICEPLELQVDFWVTPSDQKPEAGVKTIMECTKSSLRSAFRSLQVVRLTTNCGDLPSTHFTLIYTTKEKKQKIMRLGKKKEKEKDMEPRNQIVEGVLRLICCPKMQNFPLKLSIDGTEWSGVKFFQVSSQWQTHIRLFPVSIFSALDNITS